MYLKPNSPHAAAAGKSVIGFNLINGREIEGDLSLIQSKSAADHRDLVGMFPDSGEKDVARAAKAAADAFLPWAAMPAGDRCDIVHRAADLLARHQDAIARILTREIGMTAHEARTEVLAAVDACAFFAGEVQAAPDRRLASGRSSHRRPVGVCGILATGASPLAAPIRKVLPALLAGNTVVWKPSDNAPTAAYLLLRAFVEGGLPPGVVNTVNGRGRAGCGKHFLAGIEKGLFQGFGFVGSPALGRAVGEMCGRNLMLPSLDLAGKAVMVVLPGADLAKAAKEAVRAAFAQAGQRVLGLGSVIVHQDCAPAFQAEILQAVAGLVSGNPVGRPEVALGPLMNTRTANHFKEHWEAGLREGAELLTGGAAWTEANRTATVLGDLAHGAYLQPCVWSGVTPAMGLFQQPVVGPTLNLCTVDDADEALAWANLAPCRVSAAVYSEEAADLKRFAAGSSADMVAFNRPAPDPEALLAFAGFGARPGSQPALDGFTRWQVTPEPPEPGPRLDFATAPPLKTAWDEL